MSDGTWAPVDLSGAGLDLTGSTGCVYTLMGTSIYLITGNIVFPSTADTSVTQIGGFEGEPGAFGVQFFGSATPGNSLSGSPAPLVCSILNTLITFDYTTDTTSGPVTNIMLSAATININIVYSNA